MKPLDIAIAGLGPAGLAAALALARSGHRVRLFDQFDEPRPVGSGLMMQPAGLAVLDWLGLGEALRRLGAPIDRLFGREAHSGRIVLDVRYETLGNGRCGLAVHRAALFNVLFDKVKASGAAVETKVKIAAIDRMSGRRPVLVAGGGRRFGPFDLVIDALGSRSPLMDEAAAPAARRSLAYGALWTTLPWIAGAFDARVLEQRYERASVMIGVLPVGRRFSGDSAQTTFFWSLKAENHARWKAQGLGPWRDQVTRLWPETETLIAQIDDPDQMVLAAYGHHTLPLPFGDRVAFIGDSAHSTSPQLGQGANMALLDVRALCGALDQASDLDQALAFYARQRRFHIRLYQLMSSMFTPFYQSDSHVLPLFRDWLVAPASRVPLVARALARIVSGDIGLGRDV
ncbi:FAD-dependent oxidoreductase [Taklimakanibacter deserti]|uniref:FAD-dependent oxidoreductase n=1 Tax=Taklimakanibacter deserti TaxID=2267839 RepID=UPI000E64ADAA